MTTPKFITKFVGVEHFDLTKRGYLKFGTLGEYRRVEAGREARLGDASEGQFNQFVQGDVVNFTGWLGGNWFENCSFIGGTKGSVAASTSHDAYVFCAMSGPYSESAHKQIVAAGNPSLVAYVVFDASRFIDAALNLFQRRYDGGQALFDEVTYKDDAREAAVSIEVLGVTDPRQRNRLRKRALFEKPVSFQHEREFRVAFIPAGAKVASRALLISDVGADAAATFASTVVDSGRTG